MRVIRSIKQMLAYVKQVKRRGKTVGFVPTMGYLHEGHLSLARQARKDCDVVLMSIFVNPIQFGPKEDFEKYPRDLSRDRRLAESAGVDVIFYPLAEKMYPEDYLTYVDVEKMTTLLCGRSRPGHFRGVTTVVAKLFNILQPDIAYFGQKDAQQAIVIQKMVEDLNMPLKIKVMPIVRESDGLAMSSRNAYLNEKERRDATILYQALNRAKAKIQEGQRDVQRIVSLIRKMINSKKSAKIDYIQVVDRKTLMPVKNIKGKVLIILAVWIGKTRLIDNIIAKAQKKFFKHIV